MRTDGVKIVIGICYSCCKYMKTINQEKNTTYVEERLIGKDYAGIKEYYPTMETHGYTKDVSVTNGLCPECYKIEEAKI